MVAELLELSPAFREAWSRQLVRRHRDDHKTVIHPELGEIEVEVQKLFTDDRAQALVAITATPGTDAAEKLRLLSVVGTERFTAL